MLVVDCRWWSWTNTIFPCGGGGGGDTYIQTDILVVVLVLVYIGIYVRT